MISNVYQRVIYSMTKFNSFILENEEEWLLLVLLLFAVLFV